MSSENDPRGGPNLNAMQTVWDAGPAQPAETLGAGERFADRYEIDRTLGAGGMGVVYLAKDSVTREEVVLKLIHPSLLDPKARDRMISEGVNTRRIRNPHVVAVYDVGEHQGQVFLSMEHVEGRPLRAWMADNMASRIDAPLSDVLKITHEILSGLAAAHKEGVVHRDLKPENIMIAGDPAGEDFKLKILDFGIARGLKTEVFTGSTPAMGTPLYMAPEQKTTPDAVGPSADIYSVARMLYEMLMDVLPEGAWNPPSEQRADVPAALDQVIRKGLQAPKHRYQSVAEFAAALDQAVQGTKAASVSQSVWISEGGANLRDALKELDATLNERLAKGAKWLNDSFKEGASSGASKRPPPPPQPPLVETKMTDATKRNLFIGGGAVLAIGILGAVLDQEGVFDPGPGYEPDIPPRRDPQPDPEPEIRVNRTPNIAGSWRMEGGSTFRVNQNGAFIDGVGPTGGWGNVRIRGPVNGAIEVFSVTYNRRVAVMEGGLAPRPGGIPGFDWRGTVTDVNSGQTFPILFHINH